MSPASISTSIARWRRPAVTVAVACLLGGCAMEPAASARRIPATVLSPAAERVAPHEAWRLAEVYAREHPGCEVVVGSGDSMLPLYCDGTVLVVQPVAMADLRRSMTVVFIGDQGRPVAHVLTEKTAGGWRAMGVGNRERDETFVRAANLVGVVVRAYAGPNAAAAADEPALAIGTWAMANVPEPSGLAALLAGRPATHAQ